MLSGEDAVNGKEDLAEKLGRFPEHGAPRTVATPTIRPVATAAELAAAFDVAAAQFADPVTHADRRCRELLDRFPEDRPLMLVAE